MAPPSKDGRLRLGEPLATEFAALRAAIGMGNSEIGAVREAVRAFIKSRTTADKKLKRLYETELDRLMAAKRQPIRLVTTTGEPKS